MVIIKETVEKLVAKIKKRQGKVEVLKAKLKVIQYHVCQHPNATIFRSGDYSGDAYTVFDCPDCGLREER